MDCGLTREIIHVDMDAFFASVEQRDDPSLRGRPVAVGHGAARGVVAAASYEARTFGVKSALPSVTALRRCPDLIFVPPRFDVYRSVSQQIHAIFAKFSDLIQPLSLDEAYLDVTANRQGLPTAWLTAKAIRARILEETGLTASAGISYNRFLAKLASDHRKPNGQFAVTPDMGAAWVETLPVARFHGVGPVTAAKMERLGITTGAHLRAKSIDFLIDHFGSSAGWYHAIARGEDDRPVNPKRERKSSGSETTGENGRGFAVVAREVRNLAEQAANAASDIRVLNAETEDRVSRGVKLVEESGASLAAIVGEIEAIYAVSCEIANSAREQAAAIADVSSILSDIDTVGRANISRIERTAETLKVLTGRATSLTDAIRTFQLERIKSI